MGNPIHNFSTSTSINQIDEIIHRERIDNEKKKVMHQRPSSTIPDGTFILMNEDIFLFSKGRLHRWTPFGYENNIAVPEDSMLTVLTPDSIVNSFCAGYVPQIMEAS